MTSMEIARRFAELNEKENAQNTYALALEQGSLTPEEELEAASYIFYSEGDYQTAYSSFVSLYNRGYFQAELFDLMLQAFYLPNVEEQKMRYETNCRRLQRYPYLFRKDFPPFEDLPIQFFPFDDEGILPFVAKKNRFFPYVNVHDEIIDRWFFRDLEQPVLAKEVFSQYQLEYLNDNVRKSEWVARENHIYLHYDNWERFCAWLQVLDFKKLLNEEKFVFLFGDEIVRYPIDFQKEFGIDYTQFPVKPIGVREVNRLIFHAQLSFHNGGDFFNEIFFGHPNLLSYESIYHDNIENVVKVLWDGARNKKSKKRGDKFPLPELLTHLDKATLKDALVAYYLNIQAKYDLSTDPSSRIVPALMIQPHFNDVFFEFYHCSVRKNATVPICPSVATFLKSPMIQDFKYIKTFVPIRRPTTSYAAANRFTSAQVQKDEEYNRDIRHVQEDTLFDYLVNRGYLRDPDDRIYKDSRIVRFEDAKLNSKATFTALAEFLDIPYTESMLECSNHFGVNQPSVAKNYVGFDTHGVYAVYDEFTNDAERSYLEFFMRDVYKKYGYDFHYYHGETVNENWIKQRISNFKIHNFVRNSRKLAINQNLQNFSVELCTAENQGEVEQFGNKETETIRNLFMDAATLKSFENAKEYQWRLAEILLKNPIYVNKNGKALRYIEPLKLDPELLEQPLYH